MRPARLALALATASVAAGCMYSFRAGSFPPEHIKTIAIQPFDNETTRFELSGELYDQLLRNLPRALGIRTAGEDVADAVVRGVILRYDVVAPNYRAGAEGQPAEVLQRQVGRVATLAVNHHVSGLGIDPQPFEQVPRREAAPSNAGRSRRA